MTSPLARLVEDHPEGGVVFEDGRFYAYLPIAYPDDHLEKAVRSFPSSSRESVTNMEFERGTFGAIRIETMRKKR